MKVYVKKLYNEQGIQIPVTLPDRKSDRAAAYDLVATSEPKIIGQKYTPVGMESSEQGNLWKRIDWIEYETNLYTQASIQTVHFLTHPRSGNRKYNLSLANSIGLIDNDYRGMWVCSFNYLWQPEDFVIVDGEIVGRVNMDKIYKKGDAVVQVLGEMTVDLEWVEVDELNQTARGEGGHGSTDAKKQELPPIINMKDRDIDLVGMFKKSGHDIKTPNKNDYVNALKQRENNV